MQYIFTAPDIACFAFPRNATVLACKVVIKVLEHFDHSLGIIIYYKILVDTTILSNWCKEQSFMHVCQAFIFF